MKLKEIAKSSALIPLMLKRKLRVGGVKLLAKDQVSKLAASRRGRPDASSRNTFTVLVYKPFSHMSFDSHHTL